MAEDDGTFSRSELAEVRKKAGEALAVRFREVAQVVARRPELQPLLAKVLSAGTGGVASLQGAEPGGVLAALSRTGSIRLDWAQAAANLVREELVPTPPAALPPPPPATPAPARKAAPARKPAARKKAAPAAKKQAAPKKKAASKRKAAPRKAAPRKAAPKKKVASKRKAGAARSRR
jgi:hypothetical protein